jgi:threonine dehydratase
VKESQVESTSDNPFGMDDIRAAAQRLRPHVVRTPLVSSPALDAQVGARILIKAECLQITGSFKFRGALNTLLSLHPDERSSGVAAYSAGNHGQGVAAAAAMLGCSSVIVMPETAPRTKVEGCRWWGAEVVLYDSRRQNREQVLDVIARERGSVVIPPFDDHRVMAGQGTVGLELAEQLTGRGIRPDAVLVPCSGGGLSAGVTEAVLDHFPDAAIHLVEPVGMAKMAQSLITGRPEARDPALVTAMDGLSGPRVGRRPLAVLREHAVSGLVVTDEEALQGMAAAFAHVKLVLEPAGAAALAAVLSGRIDVRDRTVALVASGGNVDASVFARALGIA